MDSVTSHKKPHMDENKIGQQAILTKYAQDQEFLSRVTNHQIELHEEKDLKDVYCHSDIDYTELTLAFKHHCSSTAPFTPRYIGNLQNVLLNPHSFKNPPLCPGLSGSEVGEIEKECLEEKHLRIW